MLANVVAAIITGIEALGSSVVETIRDMFVAFVYADGTGTSTALSDIAQYLLLFFGISICIGLVWLVIGLFKRHK